MFTTYVPFHGLQAQYAWADMPLTYPSIESIGLYGLSDNGLYVHNVYMVQWPMRSIHMGRYAYNVHHRHSLTHSYYTANRTIP
jgi:hypothetical protein